MWANALGSQSAKITASAHTITSWRSACAPGQSENFATRASAVLDYSSKIPFLLQRQPNLAKFKCLLVFEVLIHHLDALRAILGEMTVLSATLDQINPELKGEDVALIQLRSDQGVLVQIDASLPHPVIHRYQATSLNYWARPTL